MLYIIPPDLIPIVNKAPILVFSTKEFSFKASSTILKCVGVQGAPAKSPFRLLQSSAKPCHIS